jgi:hypothetical protein
MVWWELQIWKIKYFLPAVLCDALCIHDGTCTSQNITAHTNQEHL